LEVTNDEEAPLDLSLITIHYYISSGGNDSSSIAVYYDSTTSLGGPFASVDDIDMGAAATTGADTRIEATYSGGSLPAGATLQLQLGVTGDDEPHDTTDDYSEPVGDSCEYAAVFYDGELVAGIPPAAP